MKREMKLRCTVGRLDETDRHLVTAKLFDGTTFTINVFQYEVLMSEPFSEHRDTVDGWVFVIADGQQGSRVSVTLAQPSDLHGRQVVVNEHDLMPRHVDISMFNPQNPIN